MAFNKFSVVTERGVKAMFLEAMATAPNVYQNHCDMVDSDAPDEKYAWLGAVPEPREIMAGGRELQQFGEFSLTLTNKGYELSFLIHRDSFADDRTGSVQRRIQQVSGAYPHFKDSLFGALLIAGETDTAFDGTAFHADTRTIGSSANIDNSLTAAAATGTVPIASELLSAIQNSLAAMWRFEDDQGRESYNADAMNRLRAVVPPEQDRPMAEALNSTVIATAAGTASQSNPWGMGILEGYDVLPSLTTADAATYISALGGAAKPFVYQQREALEVVVLNSAEQVALNHGVMVLCYERFRFGYGDPRRNIRHDWT